MNTERKFLQKIEVEPGIFEIQYQLVHNGKCQCFQDCNCAESKGQVLGKEVSYSNELVLKHNEKPKEYTSLKGCKDSLNEFLKRSN